MLYCIGADCPLRHDCYRHTQPSPRRDRFAALPYDPAHGTCEYFVTNIPSDEFIRLTAYYIWQRHGCPEGRAHEHWEEAFASLCRSTGRIKAS